MESHSQTRKPRCTVWSVCNPEEASRASCPLAVCGANRMGEGKGPPASLLTFFLWPLPQGPFQPFQPSRAESYRESQACNDTAPTPRMNRFTGSVLIKMKPWYALGSKRDTNCHCDFIWVTDYWSY